MLSMVKERLQAWMTRQKKTIAPSAILFYRDGISEFQYEFCIQHEIRQVKQAHLELGRSSLELTFGVVNKRHHARFYAADENETTYNSEGNKENKIIFASGNPRPELLIDSTVTNPKSPNFFL
jgi:eukaryotic translation initiation factor 2C